MCPRPSDRGRPIAATVLFGRGIKLQWVHGLLTVGDYLELEKKARVKWLQWVHGLLTVGDAEERNLAERLTGASMGPRPSDRGRPSKPRSLCWERTSFNGSTAF